MLQKASSLRGVSPGESLPTMEAGSALLRGDTSQILPVTGLFFWRAAAIALGMLAAGESKDKLVRNALWGSAAVQTFVLGYSLLHGAKDDVPLPSAQSANAVISGDVKSVPLLLTHWVARSTILGLGVYLGGERSDFKSLAKKSLFGGAAIEVSLLLYLWQQKRAAEKVAAAPAQVTT